MRSLLVAVAFLTRLPVRPAADARDVARAMPLFPIVGAALGAALAAAAAGLHRALPAPLVAILVVALGALATGALHLDGLADTADGLGGGRDADHALAIMKDHAVGAYGATALVLVLAVKAAAVQALLGTPGAWTWLPLAGALSRWITVPLARLPAARGAGLGAGVAAHLGRPQVAAATAIAAGLAPLLGGARGALAAAAVAALGAGFGALCLKRLRGVTGDTLGAAAELSEALVLVLAAAWAPR